MKRNKIVLVLAIGLLFIMSSCDKNCAEEKLYHSISAGNYQGVYEVLRDNPEINLEDIGVSEITDFSMKDRRALGIALSSGCSNADEIAILLIEAGSDVNSVLDYGNSYLMSASTKVADALHKAGIDVNLKDEDGMTAIDYLMRGARENQKELVYKEIDKLISRGAEPTAVTLRTCLENGDGYVFAADILEMLKKKRVETGISKGLEAAISGNGEKLLAEIRNKAVPKNEKKYIMLYAAKNCSEDTLKELFLDGYLFDVTDSMDNTTLDLAARYNGKAEIAALADMGEPIANLKDDGEDSMARSPIANALLSGNRENVNFFLDRGVVIPDNDFENAWHIVCEDGKLSSLKILRELGFEPTEEELCEGYFLASYRNDGVNMFDALLENYPCDIKDEFETSLIAQIAGSSENCAEKLLAMGVPADVEAINNAIEAGHSKLASNMIEQIQDINTDTSGQWTPLMCAVYCGNYDIVKLLIKKGADVNVTCEDTDGYACSALHIAAYCDSLDIIKYLIDNGADIHLKDSNGQTPYDLAKEYGIDENMKLLE